MSKLGLHLPLRPNLFLTFIEYVQCRFVLIGDIRKQQLPSCTDEKNRTLIKLLELAALSAYVVDLEFLQLSTCRAIRLSSQVGYTPFSFACLLSLNVIGIMGPHSKNMERFYELGTEPLRQLNKKSLLRETIYVAHRGPWREPLGRCIEALATLKREGPDYAEPEEVSVCNLLYYTLAMIKGSDHAALLADIQLAISRMDAPKYSIFNRLMRILAQVLDNQVNNRAHPTELNGPFFDERRELAVIEKGDRLTGFTYGIAKLYLSFHFGYHRDSHRFAKQCYKHRASVSGLLVIPAFRYMSSISQMLDFFETPPKGRLFKWLRRFTLLPSLLKNMLYFRLLMRRQESTFAFLYWCYRGVLMRTMGFGTAASARQSLERGIQRAEQEQYVQVTAMSYEMLGKLFPEDGYRKKVKQQAMRGYLKCANRAKVLQLKKELIGTFKV